MPGILPYTERGCAQTGAEQQLREQRGGSKPYDDPTTLQFSGNVALADEDAGSDPYNRTGRFRRLVR
jgi:hypothetical protein